MFLLVFTATTIIFVVIAVAVIAATTTTVDESTNSCGICKIRCTYLHLSLPTFSVLKQDNSIYLALVVFSFCFYVVYRYVATFSLNFSCYCCYC